MGLQGGHSPVTGNIRWEHYPYRSPFIKDDMPKIYHAKDKNIPGGAVYVDRSGPYGNPYRIDRDHNRDYVCEAHARWVETNSELKARIKRELKGKDLVCWCAPLRCHAETLMRIANEEE